MLLESDFRFDTYHSLGICDRFISRTLTDEDFSLESLECGTVTPGSTRSTRSEFSYDFHDFHDFHAGLSHTDLRGPGTAEFTSSFGHMSKDIVCSAKSRPQLLNFNGKVLITTPKMDGMAIQGSDHTPNMYFLSTPSVSSITPSESFEYPISPQTTPGSVSLMTTPAQTLCGSGMEQLPPPWSCSIKSTSSISPQMTLDYNKLHGMDKDRQSQSTLESYHLHEPLSPSHLRAGRKMMHRIRRKPSEVLHALTREPHRGPTCQPDNVDINIVRQAMYKCDYPGCQKVYRRKEHLKRHKQSFHMEEWKLLACEFCGKDQFNRLDNLNAHRKLHARRSMRNRGVEFVPAAVPVIGQEKRNRKSRALSRARKAVNRV